MENTSGFYRIDDNGELFYAPNFVYGAYDEYQLFKEEKDSYQYPTLGGWYWFDSEEQAKIFFF